MQDFFDAYIKNTRDIRKLAAPPINGDCDRKAFYLGFKENFRLIRKKANQNHVDIEKYIKPYLNGEKQLTDEIAVSLMGFAKDLVAINRPIAVDRILGLKIHEYLYQYYEDRDTSKAINELECYLGLLFHMNMITNRSNLVNEDANNYRLKWRDIKEKCLFHLRYENFKELSEMSRKQILHACAYCILFYENEEYSEADLTQKIELAKLIRKISRDFKYRALLVKFDWVNLFIKTAQYLTRNIVFETKDISTKLYGALIEAYKYQLEMINKEKDKETPKWLVECSMMRLKAILYKVSYEEYFALLCSYYDKRSKYRYDINGIFENVYLPSLMLELNNKGLLNVKKCKEVYKDLINYNIYMPKNDYLEIYINYLGEFLDNFIEFDKELSFKYISQTLLAICHAPTYIHSISVAILAKTIANNLINQTPAYFIGVCDCKDEESVLINRKKIIDYVYNCGVHHDIGKLLHIDVISEYHRSLFYEEQLIIYQHPKSGYDMLSKYASTKEFAPIAYGHHLWFDSALGYPHTFKKENSKYNSIIDIISIADCLDAATDMVCRSYNQGIELSDFINEMHVFKNKRYNGKIVDLFDNVKFVNEINHIIKVGREDAYYKMFVLYEKILGNL